MGDIFLDSMKKLTLSSACKARHENKGIVGTCYDIDELERQWFEGIEYLKKFRIIDSEHEINRFLAEDFGHFQGRRPTSSGNGW